MWTVLFLLIASVPPLAAGYQIISVTLLPQEFYVGDRVEMRVTLRTTSAVDLLAPGRIPAVEWGEIHQVRLASRGLDWDIRIVLTSFQPGTRTIPPLDFGGIVVSDLTLHVPSILIDGRRDLASPQPQILPPGTRLWISVIAMVLVVVPLSFLVFLRWGRRSLAEFLVRRRERKPYRRFVRALSLLSQGVEQIDGREFYIALLEHVRRFLSSTLETDCMASTTTELGGHLNRLLSDDGDRQTVLSLFHRGDLVKFAAAPAPVDQRRDDISVLLSIAERLGAEHRSPQRNLHARRRKQRVGV
ncbi:MAG: hypothetical protein EA403_03210 [Spirochaetaceae bacterium]|nr:MAG: hypothetical protein EA403_03210 [Spirochaetaceae bacterium]